MVRGIFATQHQSEWVQDMLRRNVFGHQDVTWRRRALLAIPDAGIEGQTLTTMEMEDALIPLIGPAESSPARSEMASIGCKAGILIKMPERRKTPACTVPLAQYHIIGHMRMVDDQHIPVLTHDGEAI